MLHWDNLAFDSNLPWFFASRPSNRGCNWSILNLGWCWGRDKKTRCRPINSVETPILKLRMMHLCTVFKNHWKSLILKIFFIFQKNEIKEIRQQNQIKSRCPKLEVEQNMSSKIRILPTVLAYFDCQGLWHLQDTFARLFLLLWYLANKEMSQKPSDKKLRLYLKKQKLNKC